MIKLRTIIDYLEWKIISNDYNEDEYILYSEYIWNGKREFKNKKYNKTLKNLIYEIEEYEIEEGGDHIHT